MRTLDHLPSLLRRAVARRELRRRGAGIDADHPQHAAAIGGLFMALRAAYGDPVSLSQCVRELARRIEACGETTHDLEVLAALPPEHLATLGKTPAEFMTLIVEIDESV